MEGLNLPSGGTGSNSSPVSTIPFSPNTWGTPSGDTVHMKSQHTTQVNFKNAIFWVSILKLKKVQKHPRKCKKKNIHGYFGAPVDHSLKPNRHARCRLSSWERGPLRHPKHWWTLLFSHFLVCFCTLFFFKLHTLKLNPNKVHFWGSFLRCAFHVDEQ